MATLQAGEKARMYALGKIARGGATRGGYVSARAFIAIDGVHVGFGGTPGAGHVGTIIDSLSITDALNEAANTCQFRINGMVPAAGAEVKITLGSKNRVGYLFAGFALAVQQGYAADKPANINADVSAVDYTWLFGFVKVTKAYRSQSASTIARDLVATYAAANGFTSHNVAPSLPSLDQITFTNEELDQALTRLAERIGAYWYVDYQKDVHLFIDETLNGAPEALTPAHKSLADVRKTADRTQVLTRVYVEGRGTNILGAVAAGDTLIPVAAVDMFEAAADVFAKISPHGSEGAAEWVSYTGVVVGGGGSLVGPGVGPPGAPTPTRAAGTALTAGPYQYAYTDVTAAGETRPSPIALMNVGGPIAPPTIGPVLDLQLQTPTGVDEGAHSYAYTFAITGGGETLGSPVNSITVVAGKRTVQVHVYGGPDNAIVANVRVYRTRANQSGPFLFAGQVTPAVGSQGSAFYIDTVLDANLGAAMPLTDTASGSGYRAVALSNVAAGPSPTTSRRIYRTAVNGAQLKLLTTLANNTATTFTDTLADGSLGANAPTGDTSGLQSVAGQVPAGSPSMILANPAPFEDGGGWAVIGNGEQVIRYTAKTASTITGIPATGTGAITAAIAYNSTITAAPMLTGIPASGTLAIVEDLNPGDEINLVVKREDTARQTTLAAMIKTGPGWREEWIQDRRLSIAEARNRGDATLALRPLEDVTIAYTCRDLRTASGKTITVTLPAPTNISGTFKIQSVTIGNFRPFPTQYPTFSVTASSSMFSFEDWLRQMQTKV